MTSQVETLFVVHRRRRFLLHALALFLGYLGLGVLAWRLGYYPVRHLHLAALSRFAAATSIAHQQSVLPIHPPLAFLAFLAIRSPIVLAAAVAGISIGYLSYFVTTYAGSPGARLLLGIYVLLSPSMITLSLFHLEWLMLVALTVASYGFLLEYCRRESVYHLFLCGISLGALYLVVPESAIYSIPFAIAATLLGPPRNRRYVYALVLLFPLLAAASGWMLIDWFLTGSVTGALPQFALSVDTPSLIVLAVTSGPFVSLYLLMCVAAAVYAHQLRSIIIVLLSAPPALIAISLSWSAPIPAFVHVPLIVSGLIVLYPYFATVVPSRLLKSILVLLLLAAIARDTYTVFFQGADSARPLTEIVRGGDDRGNLDVYSRITNRIDSRQRSVPDSLVQLEGSAVIFARLTQEWNPARFRFVAQQDGAGQQSSVGEDVRMIVRIDVVGEGPPEGFRVLDRAGGFVLFERDRQRSAEDE